MIEFKREWMVRGKKRGTGKWDVSIMEASDSSERGWHRFRSLEEAQEEMARLKAKEDWEIAHRQRKDMVIGGGLAMSTPYYSEYDVIEWEVRERQVSPWYKPEDAETL